MEFFENGFLKAFPDTLFLTSAFALNNVVLFIVVAVVALELSRRISRHGALIASVIILGAAIYAVGSTTIFAQ